MFGKGNAFKNANIIHKDSQISSYLSIFTSEDVIKGKRKGEIDRERVTRKNIPCFVTGRLHCVCVCVCAPK